MDSNSLNYFMHSCLVLYTVSLRIQFFPDQGISDIHAADQPLGGEKARHYFRCPTTGNLVSEFSEANEVLGAQSIWEDYDKNPEILVPSNHSQQMAWAEILGISQIQRDTLLKWFELHQWIFL